MSPPNQTANIGMGTSHEKLHDEAEKHVGRLLKEGNNGSLARAKETLKDRLYQQMIQEVQNGFGNAEEVAQQALDQETDWETTLAPARTALKKHLVEQLVQQALLEARQELEDTERVVEEAMQAMPVDQDAMVRIKQAFKDRLLGDMLEAAIAEIQDEVGSAEPAPEQEPTAEAPEEAVDAFQEEKKGNSIDDPVEEEERETAASFLKDEDAEAEAAMEEEANSSPLIDMHFWNDEDDANLDIEDITEPFDSVTEASGELGADPDFFPKPVVTEPGESFGDGLSAEPIAEGTPISFLAGFSMHETALDELGDGASHEVDATEAVADATEETQASTAWGAYYVYGVFPTTSVVDESELPSAGIDPESPLFVYAHGDLAAIASAVDRDTFEGKALAENLKDKQWSEAATLMHDRLVENCQSVPGFVAMPFGSVYSSLDQVLHLLDLAHTTDAVARATGHNEWTVRIYRNRETLHQRIMERSETVQGIMTEIKSKPKAEAAAIKKRMVSTIQEEISETTDHCTSEVHEQLLTYAEDAHLGTPDRTANPDKGEGIFDATYLVHGDKEFDFHTDLEALYRDYEDLGFQIDVVGPMAPVLRLPISLPTSH